MSQDDRVERMEGRRRSSGRRREGEDCGQNNNHRQCKENEEKNEHRRENGEEWRRSVDNDVDNDDRKNRERNHRRNKNMCYQDNKNDRGTGAIPAAASDKCNNKEKEPVGKKKKRTREEFAPGAEKRHAEAKASKEEAGQHESDDEPREVLFQPIPGKNYSISELAHLSKADLLNFCIAKDLSTHGSKDHLLMRILEHQVGENSRGFEDDSSIRVSSGTGECALCRDGKAIRVVGPCGHLCLCKHCASDGRKVTKCPICRCHVSSIEMWRKKKRDDIDASEPSSHGQHKESTHHDDRDKKHHTRVPHAWHGVVQPREKFLMRVPWDKDSVEQPLSLRCLMCNKWDVSGESHRKTDGSGLHEKNLRNLLVHPQWWNNYLNEQKVEYLRRYPLLKLVPFPDEKEEGRKYVYDDDLKDTVECESCKKHVPESGKFCCECGERKKKKKPKIAEQTTQDEGTDNPDHTSSKRIHDPSSSSSLTPPSPERKKQKKQEQARKQSLRGNTPTNAVERLGSDKVDEAHDVVAPEDDPYPMLDDDDEENFYVPSFPG